MPILIATVDGKPHRVFVKHEVVEAFSGPKIYEHFKLWLYEKLKLWHFEGLDPKEPDIQIAGLVDVTSITDSVLEIMLDKGKEFDLLMVGCRVASMVLGKPRNELENEEVAAGCRHVRWLLGQEVEPAFCIKPTPPHEPVQE